MTLWSMRNYARDAGCSIPKSMEVNEPAVVPRSDFSGYRNNCDYTHSLLCGSDKDLAIAQLSG